MASAVNPLTSLSSSATPPPQSSTTSGTSAPAPTEQMFLELLVAQMKNQDPESPSDPTAFVGELAQFSELEQVIGIRSDIEAAGIGQNTTPSTATTTGSNTNQTSNTTQS
ncbi:MAG TPA: flagellar hook capping FlgD N-terminal domain-containing protein [Bryobacteraceae bacterium]|nr:flagellar hook capping FlgD N-terminal domain-containing protein [Bryobacteraceae bacterium]